jgi:hypothetical protein
MATIVKRVVGVLLALVGLALTVAGVWLAAELGSSGTARFTVHPATSDPVLIGPDVLNRVDADVVVTATPTAGGSVWMALANPSDADAVVGDAKHVAVTGVSVRDWTLLTTTTGTGTAPELGAADLWRQQDDAEGPVTLTVEQSGAPETLVVKSQEGQVASLTLQVVEKSWFVEAVIAALIGLFLLVVGVVLVTSRRARHPAPVEVPPVPEAPTGTFEPVGAVEGVDGTEPTSARPDDGDGSAVASDTDVDPAAEAPADPATETPTASPPDPHDSPATQHPHDPEEVTR